MNTNKLQLYDTDWVTLLGITRWKFWENRNSLVFNNEDEIIKQSVSWGKCMKYAGALVSKQTAGTSVQVSWSLPAAGWEISEGEVLFAELWAILYGLALAWQRGYNKVES
ncbi:hypothetical protein GOBAR_DD17785 [Gossypium barbadense]|nr:hypothetical protein GOBAR_DD17785 [Gossypium barbadense]